MRWNKIKTSLKATRSRRAALRYLKAMATVAILASFLANDRPIVASFGGEVHFPIFRQMLEPISGPKPYGDLPGRSWRRAETDWAIWPPVAYSASELDMKNDLVAPFETQKVENNWKRHWLGTAKNGRDVLAGLIHGSRVALLVGIIAMSIALVIGLLLGGLAGYFGNDRLRASRYRIWGILSGVVLVVTYILVVGFPYVSLGGIGKKILALLLIPIFLVASCYLLFWFFQRFFKWWQKTVAFPIDGTVMRLIELFNSLPTLVLLIAFLPLIDSPTIFTVMLVIGLIRWTGIARFVRAELLRIRELPYIDAARLSGFSHPYILFKHALPNALGPVIIALSFGMAGAILLEAYLSFLSIGLSPDQVSWGSLLRQSRSNPTAWWLAIFPGLAIFFTILALNVLGEALRGE